MRASLEPRARQGWMNVKGLVQADKPARVLL